MQINLEGNSLLHWKQSTQTVGRASAPTYQGILISDFFFLNIFSYYLDPSFEQSMHSSKFDFNNNASVRLSSTIILLKTWLNSRPTMSPHQSQLDSTMARPTWSRCLLSIRETIQSPPSATHLLYQWDRIILIDSLEAQLQLGMNNFLLHFARISALMVGL